jgi:tRNA 2-selenouridine synthase
MIQKIRIEEFLLLAKEFPVLDVRSPGEYDHAYIPGAYSLPLFTDEERKIVGTAYKQESREIAIKKGLDFFGIKMCKVVEDAETILLQHHSIQNTIKDVSQSVNKSLLIHCWRGGMRSAAIAWLLDLYGFKVYTLAGGYKAYRNWVLAQFEKQYPFKIIGGYTGSGKTVVLHEMDRAGYTVVDLEDLAKHKGSAFGEMEEKQPTQEMFDNLLAMKLHEVSLHAHKDGCIWLEDESQRIGLVNLPMVLWGSMRQVPVSFLDIPFEERLKYIVSEYGKLPKQKLLDAIKRIEKRLGGLDAKNSTNYLLEDNYMECFRILLKYYDKHYEKALRNRENWDELVTIIKCDGVEGRNYEKLIKSNFIMN